MKRILKIAIPTFLIGLVAAFIITAAIGIKKNSSNKSSEVVTREGSNGSGASPKASDTPKESEAASGGAASASESGEPIGSDEAIAGVTASSAPFVLDFLPKYTRQTNPDKMMEFTNINVNGKTLGDISDYKKERTIDFGMGDEYTKAQGVITFRGNNFRDTPVYGVANMRRFKLQKMWEVPTGSLTAKGRYWSGNGWTGQPLLMHWPMSVKRHMNMASWAKRDRNLIEAIYASMDGNIYFIDINSGKQTRSPMKLGYVFKGAGALDPRGYPIMYVGSGYDSNNGTSRAFIINLLTCEVMYEYGNDDSFSLRGHLSFFDSSALVDAKTDTLIQPGENGILYLIKLNTRFNRRRGKLSIKPGRIVKWRYKGKRNNNSTYWLGMEDSAAIYRGYLFIADNGGNLMCLNLNTLRVRWMQDILDDSNSTPVLSVENGKLYIYISTSFHLGWRSSSTAEIPVWKIDASNGKKVWERSFTCSSVDGASGGVQSTIAVGKNNLDNYIYVTVGRTGGTSNGVLACIRKSNGRIKWQQKGPYTWSSPVCVYNKAGRGKVLYARSDSKLLMVDGVTGRTNDELLLGAGNVEASPAVYNNILVVGTRGCRIYGVKLR
ncbi:MAG: PQQ-like beta-propeller repeat protein [Lachnospiraceae bacterium]|nr:PQQ-like beta-propeller repeat protein [Lachnospiraceae bacterium]